MLKFTPVQQIHFTNISNVFQLYQVITSENITVQYNSKLKLLAQTPAYQILYIKFIYFIKEIISKNYLGVNYLDVKAVTVQLQKYSTFGFHPNIFAKFSQTRLGPQRRITATAGAILRLNAPSVTKRQNNKKIII